MLVWLLLLLKLTAVWGYDSGISEMMVGYASVSSCPSSSFNNWQCRMCLNGSGFINPPPMLTNIGIAENGRALGFVGVDEENHRLVVSFQGTVNWKEIMEDLELELVEEYCLGCKVHKGFYEAYKSIEDDISKLIESRMKSNYQIWFTGHSMGGALAIHAALALNYSNIVGYTFGAPRIGNKLFAEMTRHLNWFRVVNYKDPVPQLLPFPMYYHTDGPEIWYYDEPRPGFQPSTKFKTCLTGEDSTCQRSVCNLPFHLCTNGKWHTTYMNLAGLTDLNLVCFNKSTLEFY